MEAADGPPGWLQEAAASVGLEALKHETSQSEYSPFRSTDRMEYSPFNMGRPPRPVLTPSLDADGDGGGIFGGIFAPDSDSAESEPLGVFVTADEVIELQRWAEERRVLRERLEQTEQLATARGEEARALEKRLATAEVQLRTALRGTRASAAGAAPAAAPRLALPMELVVRRSSDDAEALATARCEERVETLRDEAGELRSEFRALSALRKAQREAQREKNASQ